MIWFTAPVLVVTVVIVFRRGALAILVSTAPLLIGINLDFQLDSLLNLLQQV